MVTKAAPAVSTNGQKGASDVFTKVLLILLTGMCALIMFFGGFILNGIAADVNQLTVSQMAVQERLASIEADRFTSAHGLEVWKKIAEIQEQLTEVRTQQVGLANVVSRLPPEWLTKKVDHIESTISAYHPIGRGLLRVP